MGLGDVLFGGLGKPTNVSDPSYAATNPQQAGIDNLMGQSAAQVDPNQQAAFRQMQLQQAQRLQAIASGQQQGAGELAAQRQVQNALAAQQSMAHMARGGQNAALAFRGAANNAANVGLAGAGMSQQAALQDQQMAQGQLTGALGQGRGQDLSLAGQNAQMLNQRYGENLNAYTGLNAQQLGAQQTSLQAALGQQGIAGGLINTAGTIIGAGIKSDERLKTDVRDAGDDIDEMLNGLHAKTYRYKDEQKHGVGERSGIMAQDLTKSKAGSALVINEPDGLAIDPGKAISAALAATARLHERVRKLEGARGR